MASGTMREPVVSSPQPAITLQSGSAIEENENSPCCHETKKREKESEPIDKSESDIGEIENSDQFYQKIDKSKNLIGCGLCSARFSSPNELDIHNCSRHDRNLPPLFFCTFCNDQFTTEEQFRQHHHHRQGHRHRPRQTHDRKSEGEEEAEEMEEEMEDEADEEDVNEEDFSSNHSEDCPTSNNKTIESNISTNLSTSKNVESGDGLRTVKSLRLARRQGRKAGERGQEVKGFGDSESPKKSHLNRRKVKILNNNNNDYSEVNQFRCPVCERELNSWNVLQIHLEKIHPEYEIKCDWCNLSFDSPRVLNLHRFMAHNVQDGGGVDVGEEEDGGDEGEAGRKSEVGRPRKKLNFDYRKNPMIDSPKIIGFRDINFVDFSSGKFPLIAKDVCEKSVHLSKGNDFSFDCQGCGRGFPCEAALEMHVRTTCERSREKRDSPPQKSAKKNKRKSTPKFRPQHSSAGTDSEDSSRDKQEGMNVSDLERKTFFNSLDLLRNAEAEEKSMDGTGGESERERHCETEPKTDLADIESILSVANRIPEMDSRDFSGFRERKAETEVDGSSGVNLNVRVSTNCRSSPESHSGRSLNSPNFNVLNLVSPNQSGNDLTEEEAQDCFAAECRRMKLRGEFPCKLCSAVFPNLRALKGHNRVHVSVAKGTPNSPYRCNICPYHSLDKATLVRHMRSHNGDRPYECAMCNYAFTTKANCERHLRNRHSKITRDEVKGSIIYHPSEDPTNDSDYQKTAEMNRRNLEKSARDKQEFGLPINLKINLTNLTRENPAKSEDLFQAEHRELIRNIKSEEESRRTETGTMTDLDFEGDAGDWRYEEERGAEIDEEEALDLRMYKKEKNYESDDSSDVPQDLSKKEEVKEFNNNIEEKSSISISADPFGKQPSPEGKSNSEINNLVKMYSSIYPSLNVTQIQQIILTQLNFPGIFQKLSNFPFPPFLMTSPLIANANNYVQKTVQKDLAGLQMSGGNILDEKNRSLTMSEKLQFFQQQALAEVIFKREKDRLAANDYFKKTPPRGTFDEEFVAGEKQKSSNRLKDFIKQNTDYFSDPGKKTFGEILLSRSEEKKEAAKMEKSVENSRNSSVKMVIKNGVLIPKQKQRRYRTERPFSCEYCSARFTLRSNMERHIKQQHPQYWTQKSRSNVGNLRKSDPNPVKLTAYDGESDRGNDYLKHYDVAKPISLVSRDNLNTSGGETKWKISGRKQDRNAKEEEIADPTKGREWQQWQQVREETPAKLKELELKREVEEMGESERETKDESILDDGKKETKRNRIQETDGFGGSENASDCLSKGKRTPETAMVKEGTKEPSRESQPQDLASVSRMLDDAVTQTQAFQKYFQEGSKKEEDFKRERDEGKRDEGERSEEEEGLVAGSTSSDENRSESEASSRSGKKKSAYSLAPNRVSCPYCFRKFPWTSSLRRHVLTHTGQKPFKCTHCPYLFTTKSNCDRHLLRKHGREALLASSGQTENPESTGNAAVASSAPSQTQNSGYPMRNVPERPYKCNQCPSSTFSTLSNLNKHLFSKHNGQHRSESEANQSLPVTPDVPKPKNLNPQAPPNITISSTFSALSLPRTLSIIPQYGDPCLKMAGKGPVNCKAATSTVPPTVRVIEMPNCNGSEIPLENSRAFRKRSSSEEIETTEKKRTSPDVKNGNNEFHNDSDGHRPSELLPIPPGELPFKCHLCDSSFGERSDALDHIRCQHPSEFQLLVSKGALEATNTDEEKHQPEDNDEVLESNRGRFPDYANRKVMCAFCMRRFWSAEDLRRHMRTHTGERPFSCDVCQRRFTLKHSMLRHRKKHSAHDEILVGSDEEHHHHHHNHQNPYRVNHNNNISVAASVLQKPSEPEEGLHRTILHQTLTRRDDSKDDLRGDPRISERIEDGSNGVK